MLQELTNGHSELVSIITAVKNSEFVIERCFNSVARQTHQLIEHVLVLGNSSDNTENIITKYILNNPKSCIKVLRENKPGIYSALNQGIKESKGEFLLILGSDDWLEPFGVHELITTIKQKRADFAVGYAKIITEDNKKNSEIFKVSEFDERLIMGLTPFCHQALLVSKKCFDICGLFNEDLTIASDRQWFNSLFLQKLQMATLSKCVVNFCKKGLSNSKEHVAIDEIVSCIEKQYNLNYDDVKLWLDFLRGENQINLFHTTNLINNLTDIKAIKSVALLLLDRLYKITL